jgi:hypothetical protein
MRGDKPLQFDPVELVLYLRKVPSPNLTWGDQAAN